ncbi:MAG: HD domain-containing protein [Spirochaetes bacterium]|nr:HD domain-containing protein [Spirochaetota bacterium]
MDSSEAQLSRMLSTSSDDPNEIIEAQAAETRRIFLFWFDDNAYTPVALAFESTCRLFAGRFPGYRACNTDYHDLRHTVDAFLASARLMDGVLLSGRDMGSTGAVDLLMAALFHDTGYIQESGDMTGTGAKYTLSHVDRSVEFVVRNAPAFGLDPERARAIGRIIECTDIRLGAADLEFVGPDEETAGYILGTADILGQMADRAYLEKLLFLYYEFREAGFPGYETEFDILRKTMAFYDSTVKRLDEGFRHFRGFERTHFRERFGIDRELYRESIERQMAYLASILDDNTVNFRRKLKRVDLEKLGTPRAS